MITYIGGKMRMADWISSFVPECETYVEVFGGAYWVYINSDVYERIDKAVYNDFNPYMTNIFRCSSTPTQFSKFVDSKNIPLQSGPEKSTLDECRQFFNKCKDDLFATNFAVRKIREVLEDKSIVKKERKSLNEAVEFVRNRRIELNNEIRDKFGEKIRNGKKDQMAAVQYVFLLTNCFSGASAVDATFTDDSKKNSSKFESFHKKLSSERFVPKLKKISCCDNMSFEEVIEKYDSPTTYFYCDPPYWNTEDYYSLHGFGRDEHFRLKEILHDVQGKFSLSYYDFPQLREWYPTDNYVWEKKKFVKPSGARGGEEQSIGEEVLIMNY